MKRVGFFALAAALAALTTACSRNEFRQPAAPSVPTVTGPVIDPQNPPPTVELSNGAEIELTRLGSRVYFMVEGTFSESSFTRVLAAHAQLPESERAAIVKNEIDRTISKLRALKILSMSTTEAVGYFTFLMPYQPELLAPLKALSLEHAFLFTPVTTDRNSLRAIRAMSPLNEGLEINSSISRADTAAFSGLTRINVPAFLKQAQSDIGGSARVNGDQVQLGITDTGITLNHPAFLAADGKSSRIRYMKDFTREGRVYFNPAAKFSASEVASDPEALALNAQVIVTPKLPNLPAADQFTEVKNLKIKVSAELKKLLLDPSTHARLGVLMEDSLQADEELDLNANGKLDDRLWMILIAGATPADDILYFEGAGTGDFRRSTALKDWNSSGLTATVFAEKFGFSILKDKLPQMAAVSELEVRSVSLVGLDAGNHGSHVAGIAAGLKTIANDDDETLARGVAPEANILMNRVCANNGGCNATQAMIDLALNGKADLVNMSLGGLNAFNDGFGVQETVINRLTVLKNVLFILSAGNSGPGKQTVGSPSTARLSLSVGAAASVGMIQRQYQWPASNPVRSPEDDTDFMLFFSSRGPTAAGGFKPSLSAPGTELSAVRLNNLPGVRGGLDVYWGTSMAAPTAAGAYALLLDAVRKYNATHAGQELSTSALTLRRVLMESARPFDVRTLDTSSKRESIGQYTWMDQGMGMVDLLAAWKKLFELRDGEPSAAVKLASGQAAELEYLVVVPAKNPNGVAYDGTRPGAEGGDATFGTGLYLDAMGTDTLRPVYIQRKLPESLATSEEAGELTRQLLTTADEFVLKTVVHGSSVEWFVAGGLDQLNCAGSDTARLMVLGSGVEIGRKEDGSSLINPIGASVLNVCLDREKIASLAPGDHGAIISAYRVVRGKVAPVAAFQVPVYLQVPHRALVGSNGYEVAGEVKSFGVTRNYVRVAPGTSLIQITLQVPALKRNSAGRLAPGESCSGVELMAMLGTNTDKAFASRPEARTANCDAKGNPIDDEKKRTVRFTRANPPAGVWDLHVFGQYRFARSRYVLKVDYVTAAASVKEISGTPAALKGTFEWKLEETSMSVLPSSEKSRLELDSLLAGTRTKVAKDEFVIVEGPLGKLRKYPESTQSVRITTGDSPGNDIDLRIIECDADATDLSHPSCADAGASGGSTDVESVTFKPAPDKVYAVRVDGYAVGDEGAFTSTESIRLKAELGSVTVMGIAPQFTIAHSFVTEGSTLLSNPLFRAGKYAVGGSLTLRTADDVTLYSLPVSIRAE